MTEVTERVAYFTSPIARLGCKHQNLAPRNLALLPSDLVGTPRRHRTNMEVVSHLIQQKRSPTFSNKKNLMQDKMLV